MKNQAGKSTIAVLALAFIMVVGLAFKFSSPVLATACQPVDKYITKSSDSTSEEVNFDFNGSSTSVQISADSGYTITEVLLDVDDDGHNGYFQYGTSAGTYNPNPGDEIYSAKVRVIKVCSTPTATATATTIATATPQSVSVNVCHQDGQSGNYSNITVSVHSVNDANGLNGHGGHGGDIWAPFTYNSVNYPGQGNYNGYNLITCNPNTTATPTPTATPVVTGTPVATETPVASPTPTATPVVTSTPDNDVCDNIEGIQTSVPGDLHLDASGNNCVQYEFGGPGDPGTGGGSVLGTSTSGSVLGASTMPATGTFAENLYLAIMALGGTLTFKGLKNFKKAN